MLFEVGVFDILVLVLYNILMFFAIKLESLLSYLGTYVSVKVYI